MSTPHRKCGGASSSVAGHRWREQIRRVRLWVAAVAVPSVLAAVGLLSDSATVLDWFGVAPGSQEDGSQTHASAPPLPGLTGPTAAPTVILSTPDTSEDAGGRDECATGYHGTTASCDEPGNWWTMGLYPCNRRMLIESLGLPAGLPLDVETDPLPARGCQVRPGPIARSVGATSQMLKDATRQTVNPALLVCLAADETDVPCVGVHVAEPTTTWRLMGDDAYVKRDCEAESDAYSNGRMSWNSGGLQSGVQKRSGASGQEVRCVIFGERPLVSSVFRLGSSPIPWLVPKAG